MTFHWQHMTTAQRVDAIKSVYTLGASASEIAAAIGGVTRNAIVGMYNRYGKKALSQHPLGGGKRLAKATVKRRQPLRAKTGQWRSSAERAVITKVCGFDREDNIAVVQKGDLMDLRGLPVAKPIRPQPVEDDGYTPRNVTLLDLERNDCRWPTNDAAKGEIHLFCGHTRLAGYSWCERHYAVAFRAAALNEPMQERRDGV